MTDDAGKLNDFLLPDSNAYIKQQRDALINEAQSEPAEVDESWKRDLLQQLRAKDMSWGDLKLPADVLASDWSKALTQRERIGIDSLALFN